MAVDADYSKIRDWEQLHSNEYEFALTQSFCTLGWTYGWFDLIGMGQITEKNWREVWARFAVMQGLGIIRMSGMTTEDQVWVTKSDIERRIGLSTNYSNLTRTAWQSQKLKVVMNIIAEGKA